MGNSMFTHRKDQDNYITYDPTKPEPRVRIVCGDWRSGGEWGFNTKQILSNEGPGSYLVQKEFGRGVLLKLREATNKQFTKDSFPLVFRSEPVTLRYEDRGQACITEIEDPYLTDIRPDSSESSSDGYGVFLRFQSWDGKREHPLHKAIAGKKLKVTIEILE